MSIWAKTWAYKQHPKRIDEDGNKTDRKHPAAKSVLVALAEYPGPGQRDCWPSQQTLALMTDYSERQVRACLADLEAQGLIKRTERRRKDGSRRSDRVTLLGPLSAFGPGEVFQDDQPEESSGCADHQPEESSNQPEESSGHEPLVSTNRQFNEEEVVTNVPTSSSAATESEDSDEPPEEATEEKPMPYGAFAVKELKDRVEAARKRGADIHDPPEPQNYGRFFKTRIKRHDVDTLLMVLDYLVAKASGEIENEPKAWCGFDTALDAVLAGWRPRTVVSQLDEKRRERLEAEQAENDRLFQELMADV